MSSEIMFAHSHLHVVTVRWCEGHRVRIELDWKTLLGPELQCSRYTTVRDTFSTWRYTIMPDTLRKALGGTQYKVRNLLP